MDPIPKKHGRTASAMAGSTRGKDRPATKAFLQALVGYYLGSFYPLTFTQNSKNTKLNCHEIKTLNDRFFALFSLSFMACSQETVAPANGPDTEEAWTDCQCDGGIHERERPSGD
jgi:hypothetical protein